MTRKSTQLTVPYLVNQYVWDISSEYKGLNTVINNITYPVINIKPCIQAAVIVAIPFKDNMNFLCIQSSTITYNLKRHNMHAQFKYGE